MTAGGYMYILICADGSYYTGSTKNLVRRILEHQTGEGANHTKKRLLIELVYYEEFSRIDLAYNREKQIQRWTRKKKEVLIKGQINDLPLLATCKNISSHKFELARKHQNITPYIEEWAREILNSIIED